MMPIRHSTWLATWLAVAGTLLALGAFAGAAAAQTRALEDRYIASRNAALAKLTVAKAAQLGDAAVTVEDRARADLERQMRAIVGPVAIEGLGAGKLSLAALYESDMGYGTLDGLIFESEDYKTQIVVTTRTLFMRWLRGHRNWGEREGLPQQPEQAFGTEAFYFQAMMSEAAILKFAGVPLGAGVAKPAVAMAAARTQSEIPFAADDVYVAAIKGDRAFVGHAPLEPALLVPACKAEREAAEKEAEAASAGQDQGKAAMQRIDALRAKSETDFRTCFAARAPKEAAFADVVKRAQELYARMPAR